MIQYVESEQVELKAEYTDTICEVISEACFTDINDSTIVLTEEEKSRIFVFDEDYVDKNIKLLDSGLDTIIMLGQQAAVNLGDDTDTVGAVVGGLAGLAYGYENIPKEWLDVIVKKDWINKLCEDFANIMLQEELRYV